jgi:predicted phosphodiesterase
LSEVLSKQKRFIRGLRVLYLIFSDIHSNLEALNRMLKEIPRIKPDAFVFLGDIVGYGPNPNEVINKIKKIKSLFMVRGNHDKVASEIESSDYFNMIAERAIRWTAKKLSIENKNFVKKMPKGPLLIRNDITIFHGSFFDEDYYIMTPYDALLNIQASPTNISFFGHTHQPIIYKYSQNNDFEIMTLKSRRKRISIPLDKDGMYLINPGSIGQPRDKDSRISFMTYDTKTMQLNYYRFKYPFLKTAAKIRKQKLPPFLGERLGKGV